MHRAPFVALALGGLLAAQDPAGDAAAVKLGLASDKAVDVACAAHAARAGDKQLAAPLQTALAKWRNRKDAEAGMVCLHLLDALIHLDVRMPAADLVPLVDDETCGVAAFVLIAREPKHNEAVLLELFRRDWPQVDPARDSPASRRALAIGDLLAPQAPPGFAALLTDDLDLDLRIAVVELEGMAVAARNQVRLQGRIKVAGIRQIAMGAMQGPNALPGWPPAVRYEIEHPVLQSNRQRVTMPAAMRTRLVRQVAANKEAHMSFQIGQLSGEDAASDVLRWLAAAADLAIPATERCLPLHTPQVFVADVVSARERKQRFVDTLRERLLARQAMTPEEALVLDRAVDVQLVDERNDSSRPLPRIPPAPARPR